MQARSAEPTGEAKAIIDELNASYLYGVSEKSDKLAHRIIAHHALSATPTNPERLVDWRGHCEWLLDLDEIHVGEGETDVIARIASIRAALSAAPLKEASHDV